MNASSNTSIIARVSGLIVATLVAACTSTIGSMKDERLLYNEAMKAAAEEQLLLNIVRLRYSDTPSSLTVSSIAMQTETQRSFGILPFFGTANNESELRRFTGLLPQFQVQSINRPTISLTPLDDQDFTRRLFTPMTAEGVLYLAKTSWPIATVFRLWLENLNWVPNASSASGPTPARAPELSEFERGMGALQALQDRNLVVFSTEEREEALGSDIAAERVAAADLIAAAKEGFEYRAGQDGKTWTLIKRKRVPVMRVHPDAIRSAEMTEVARIFRLRRDATRFDIEIEKIDPFTYPPRGMETIDLETRSLLQVLYFVSKGIEVPADHVQRGFAVQTRAGDGQPFDWSQVTRGLFRVVSVTTEQPPAWAHVAVKYLDHWFCIDKRDADTMSTFSLLMELARLELPGASRAGGPTLTLPLGGR